MSAHDVTAAAQVRQAHLNAQFIPVAAGYLEVGTRPWAEAMMKLWSDGDDPMLKAMADHWIARAHAIVQGGMQAGKAIPVGHEVHPVIAQILARHAKKRSAKKPAKTHSAGNL